MHLSPVPLLYGTALSHTMLFSGCDEYIITRTQFFFWLKYLSFRNAFLYNTSSLTISECMNT